MTKEVLQEKKWTEVSGSSFNPMNTVDWEIANQKCHLHLRCRDTTEHQWNIGFQLLLWVAMLNWCCAPTHVTVIQIARGTSWHSQSNWSVRGCHGCLGSLGGVPYSGKRVKACGTERTGDWWAVLSGSVLERCNLQRAWLWHTCGNRTLSRETSTLDKVLLTQQRDKHLNLGDHAG